MVQTPVPLKPVLSANNVISLGNGTHTPCPAKCRQTCLTCRGRKRSHACSGRYRLDPHRMAFSCLVRKPALVLHRKPVGATWVAPTPLGSGTHTPPKTKGFFSAPGSPLQVEELAKAGGIVWGMAFLNPQHLLFTLKRGEFYLLNVQTRRVRRLSCSLPGIYTRGQGGLMDVRLHPRFGENQRVYFTYSKKKQKGVVVAVAYGILKGDKIHKVRDIFLTSPALISIYRFGGRLAFGPGGGLFAGFGDRSKRKSSQDLKSHWGKVIRIHEDEGASGGRDAGTFKEKVRAEIYSRGHRNPQGLFFHPKTRVLYTTDHGPLGGDEINITTSGGNYGWPHVSTGREYWGGALRQSLQSGDTSSFSEPLIDFKNTVLAPSSLMIYSGRRFRKWEGHLFVTSLVQRQIFRISLSKEGAVTGYESLLPFRKERFRHILEGPDGWIYASTDKGHILRLKPPSPVFDK